VLPAAILRGGPRAPRVLVAVNSKQSHTEFRALARETWASQVESSAAAFGFDARVRFVLSAGANASAAERSEGGHADLLALPVPEGYDALAQKTAALLSYFDARAADDALVEVDDDVFVHLEPLWAKLRDLGVARDGPALYAGYAQKMPTPQNAQANSKWFVPPGAREHIPTGRYVTGQLKVLSRRAVRGAVAAMPRVGLQPHGLGRPETQIAVEDEYLGVLMHAAGVDPVAIQRAVAPQCCAGSARGGATDVFLVLDGDEYFVKTHNGKKHWDDGAGTADSLCRYRLAAERFRSPGGSRGFCLSTEELSLARCPPRDRSTVRPDTDAMLAHLC